MGTWSGQPFGSDPAGDWAYDLDDASGWGFVRDALTRVIGQTAVDADDAVVAIAAAEVVAHGLGRPTQSDAYTESVGAFVQRVGRPDASVVRLALEAIAASTSPESELTELWVDEDSDEWFSANDALKSALDAGLPGLV